MLRMWKTNKKNSITTSIFRNLVEEKHPIADNDGCISQIPKNTFIIESAIFDRNNDRCGDTNMRVARSKKLIQYCTFLLEFPLFLLIISISNMSEEMEKGVLVFKFSEGRRKINNSPR